MKRYICSVYYCTLIGLELSKYFLCFLFIMNFLHSGFMDLIDYLTILIVCIMELIGVAVQNPRASTTGISHVALFSCVEGWPSSLCCGAVLWRYEGF